VYTNLDVLKKNSLRDNVKMQGNVMSEEKYGVRWNDFTDYRDNERRMFSTIKQRPP
jgi:hypothetical protein